MSNSYIESVHADNHRLIALHSIKNGTYFRSKKPELYAGGTVVHIHGMYGWVITNNDEMPQQVSDLLEGWTIE